jgi:hypothetical protein
VVATTKDGLKVGFELYYIPAGISEIIQKIQQGRERAANVARWVAASATVPAGSYLTFFNESYALFFVGFEILSVFH